jgi:hypothetical protein
MNQPIKNPLLVSAKQGVKQHTTYVQSHHTRNFSKRNISKRIFVRNSLPSPADYYRTYFPYLPSTPTRDWMNVSCCFHEDKNPSLSINFRSGGFHCFACGAKGGDIVGFHMQRYGMSFVETVTFFGAWIYEN